MQPRILKAAENKSLKGWGGVVSKSNDLGGSQRVPEQPAALFPPARSSSVWERLKQHKVAQWTLAYAAAAYALLMPRRW
jgi:hypothetical protein